ncbi:MAG TPA: aspartate/glutamate racemase family protein, partial [Gaiellaceae bacterium]|nr:aspartate/glutamate racemase family protein [Gaiellaceae bacterium]
MRIWWQSFVDPDESPAYFERLGAYLRELAQETTTVDVVGLTPPDRSFGRLTELRCAVLAVDNALEAAERGYDAFAFGHFQDPGLYEARSAVDIPVTGLGEATLHWAAQVGRRLALVSIDPVFDVWHREQADLYGLGERISHVVGLGALVEDFGPAFAGDAAARSRLL